MRFPVAIALALGVTACEPGPEPPGAGRAGSSAPGTAEAATADTSPPDASAADAATPDHPDEGIERLPPAAFPGLPDTVRAVLTDRGCTVAQTWLTDEPHNVVSGELATRGQVDVAVLCSRDGASAVVVVWGGPARCADTMEPSPDQQWTQHIGGGLMGYSRALGVSGPAETFAYLSDRGYDPPPLDHDVLSDAFVEKASTMYYCQAGEWRALGGAD